MSWEEIPQGDFERLGKYAAMMGQVVPQCNMSTLDDMKKMLIKKGDYYDYKDKEHEIVLGFTYSNGKDMWRISQLAFKGELNINVYAKVREGILNFMDQAKVDKVYAVLPRGLPADHIMAKFYSKIEDSTYWKIIKEKDGSWVLPRSGSVEIKKTGEVK
jgi:hypothetical protein